MRKSNTIILKRNGKKKPSFEQYFLVGILVLNERSSREGSLQTEHMKPTILYNPHDLESEWFS